MLTFVIVMFVLLVLAKWLISKTFSRHQSGDWLWRLSLKWPVPCWLGCWTLPYLYTRSVIASGLCSNIYCLGNSKNLMIDWVIVWLMDWPTDLLTDLFIYWSVDRLIDLGAIGNCIGREEARITRENDKGRLQLILFLSSWYNRRHQHLEKLQTLNIFVVCIVHFWLQDSWTHEILISCQDSFLNKI